MYQFRRDNVNVTVGQRKHNKITYLYNCIITARRR